MIPFCDNGELVHAVILFSSKAGATTIGGVTHPATVAVLMGTIHDLDTRLFFLQFAVLTYFHGWLFGTFGVMGWVVPASDCD